MSDFASPRDVVEGGRVTYGADDGLLVEFYIKPRLMEALSKERGYPTYEDRINTRIVSPGNTKTTWDYETKGVNYLYGEEGTDQEGTVIGYEVDEGYEGISDITRFPKAWAKFTKKNEKLNDGWAIEEWGAIPRSFAETLKSMAIPTVEALAGLSDAAASNIMGGLKFRNLARAALDERENTAQLSAAQELAERQKEDNRQLTEQMAALKAEIASLKGSKKREAA